METADGSSGKNAPWIILEITARCNAECTYCYNVWHGRELPEEPGIDTLCNLFRKLMNETAVSGVTIAGGEPLLSPFLTQMVKFLSSLDLPVGLATNGLLLDRGKARELADAGVRYFEISMPAMEKETGIRLTGTDITHPSRNAVIAVRPFAGALTVSSVLTAVNSPEIPEIALTAWSLSADAFYINRFVPGGRGSLNASELTPDDTCISTVLTELNRFSERTGFPICTGIPIEPCIFPHSRWSFIRFGGCVCGETKWVIDPAGNLRTCEQNPEVLGNLMTHSLKELVSSEKIKRFRMRGLRGEECSTCGEKTACGGGCRFL